MKKIILIFLLIVTHANTQSMDLVPEFEDCSCFSLCLHTIVRCMELAELPPAAWQAQAEPDEESSLITPPNSPVEPRD